MDNPVSLDERYEARVVSLYSRGIQDKIPVRLNRRSDFYSFCYYDIIQVEAVKIGSGPVLKSAYECAHAKADKANKEWHPAGLRQFLVAVTDVAAEAGQSGYTRKEIDEFWSRTDQPLLFVSMINIKNIGDIDEVLANIKRRFPAGRHLAYLTFDHCDIILFFRGSRFQEYTNFIFQLCYADTQVLEDTITLYGFSSNKSQYSGCTSPETFTALIRVGMRDFPSAQKFFQAVDHLGKPVERSWLLGRNDASILCRSATLSWLRDVRELLIHNKTGTDAHWYTTYDLIVFSPDGSEADEFQEKTSPPLTDKHVNLQERMEKQYTQFYNAYMTKYRDLESRGIVMTPNEVWLRWLKESCDLVVSLLDSRLSLDLGTCLVPQFQDLLTYTVKLFCSENMVKRDHIEIIHEKFGTFFSNIAILIDSLNQTNRQFVQVPAFHLPSFEIPPQIMAYYTVLAHRLLEVCKDDKYFYGLTIAPKLVSTLSVYSLALRDVLKNDQWICMNMDEMSSYTLRLTTETIAHEISHFVGKKNRNREERKKYVIQCAFQELFGNALLSLARRVDELCIVPGTDALPPTKLTFSWRELSGAAEAFWSSALTTYPREYAPDSANYSDELEGRIWAMPDDILSAPELYTQTFDSAWDILCRYKDEPGSVVERILTFIRWELGIKMPVSEIQAELEMSVKDEARRLFLQVMQEYRESFSQYRQGNSPQCHLALCQIFDSLRTMFRETFADLQAILLLEMTWADYSMLLKRDKQRRLVDDCPPRMLAVTKVLIAKNVWLDGFTYDGKDFLDVQEALGLSPETDSASLGALGFNSTVIFYLTRYLEVCASNIIDGFAMPQYKHLVKKLRKMHENLLDSTPMLKLQKELLEFIDSYQQEHFT